jgi:hypothetical protein
MKKSFWLLAAAFSLLLTGCNTTSSPTPGSQTNQTMTLPSGSTPGSQTNVPSVSQASFFNNGSEHERFDHVVIVIEENHAENEVIGDPNMPYINSLTREGALMTNSHGVTHPSEPNYLALFSGSDFGYADDACTNTVTGRSLGSQLLDKGLGFAWYSEDLPAQGSTTCTYTPPALQAATGDAAAGYREKHNAAVFFQIAGTLPAFTNKPFTEFPQGDFDRLPTVSFVVPDQWHDEHDGPDTACDQWLQQNLDSYKRWAKEHNSILIVTWDEDDSATTANLIPTIIVGAEVIQGQYNQDINHYNVLRTIENMYDLEPLRNAATADPIKGIFR